MKEILRLYPAFKDYIWGGKTLKAQYDINYLENIAEAWVLSSHKDGNNIVSGGFYNGLKLSKAMEKMGKSCLGKKAEKFKDFPQLIKLIDAAHNLSVQVHPSDEYALEKEGQYGKTEMWYVLDAKENSGIYYGFKKEISKSEFKERIENNNLLEVLNFVPAKKGDCFFIPSGTIHAIGEGLLIAEIQQNSNVTYRVYDYGRKGNDGKPRELHVDKALEVANLTPVQDNFNKKVSLLDGGKLTHLAKCDYFDVSHLEINGEYKSKPKDSFVAVLIISGKGKIEGMPFGKNSTFFIPADYGEYTLNGDFEALISTL